MTIPLSNRPLTAAEFQGLAEVPPELEWFANITNAKTRRAYQFDVRDFTRFCCVSSEGSISVSYAPTQSST